MIELPRALFDVYILSLPYGHSFGNAPPIEAWQSESGVAFGAITQDMHTGQFGLIALRRQVDHIWRIAIDERRINTKAQVLEKLKNYLSNDSFQPLQSNRAPRRQLHDLDGRTPSDLFKVLFNKSHRPAAWILNQLYLCFPKPDENWVSDFQTSNTHTRMWEAHLLGSFKEQGLKVTQDFESPDFKIETRSGKCAWVEAVTANPKEPYNHVNAKNTSIPKDIKERTIGESAVRFAKTIGNKLDRKYHLKDHVNGQVFTLALADFQSPGSMMWSRESLICYIYGQFVDVHTENGIEVAQATKIDKLLGKTKFPAGLFSNAKHEELSAIIFTNSCSISKFNRVPISAGADTEGLRYTRVGQFYDRSPKALKGIDFCLEITSNEYRSLWPQKYEPWSAEIEVFHNPFAKNPLDHDLLPEVTHWFERNGELISESYYETSILWSSTVIQSPNDTPLTHQILKQYTTDQ